MKLHIQDKSGDTEVVVDENTELATQLFKEAMESGKMAYAEIGGVNTQIFDLNEAIEQDADRVLVIPHYVGG